MLYARDFFRRAVPRFWPASRAAPSCASLKAPHPPLVTPAASDHLLCQASPACACDVHRVRLGAAVVIPLLLLRRASQNGISSNTTRSRVRHPSQPKPRDDGPTAPGRPPFGRRTGAVEGARGNGEVPPKRRDSSARAGGDRVRSARLTLFFARRASSEKGWVGSEAEAAGGPTKPSLCGWLRQAERWAGGEAPPAQIRLSPHMWSAPARRAGDAHS